MVTCDCGANGENNFENFLKNPNYFLRNKILSDKGNITINTGDTSVLSGIYIPGSGSKKNCVKPSTTSPAIKKNLNDNYNYANWKGKKFAGQVQSPDSQKGSDFGSSPNANDLKASLFRLNEFKLNDSMNVHVDKGELAGGRAMESPIMNRNYDKRQNLFERRRLPSTITNMVIFLFF